MARISDIGCIEAQNVVACDSPGEALAEIGKRYREAIQAIKSSFDRFLDHRNSEYVRNGYYPYVCVSATPDQIMTEGHLAFGSLHAPGIHGTTLTAPHLFEHYYREQLALLFERYGGPIYVGTSETPIPMPFAVEEATAQVSRKDREAISRHFAMPDLTATNDGIVDGSNWHADNRHWPLALFSAERVDYSLHRMRHYTGTEPRYFQRFVLFTNYQRYVDEFINFGKTAVLNGDYESFVEPGNRVTTKDMKEAVEPISKLPQMPAYHLCDGENMGITLVNIGVGPSNAKTITDHLAVLRPHCWLMVGHCGGLRNRQRLGDYVLAHAYLRDDHVLDDVLPSAIPLPTIAEVQLAMATAVSQVTGLKRSELKERLRTGTVVTTDDRNWELRHDKLSTRLNLSRAIAIDMESATIAANGFRFRVPYGTLLCVSDRPLHGEIKLPGMADAFYEERVSQHLKIGIRALELLKQEAVEGSLHSRKLRSFDEPAFR